jgi:hypothetical protein
MREALQLFHLIARKTYKKGNFSFAFLNRHKRNYPSDMTYSSDVSFKSGVILQPQNL